MTEHDHASAPITFAIITCSDTRGMKQDTAGAALEQLIADNGWVCRSHVVVKDEVPQISAAIVEACDTIDADIVLTCGPMVMMRGVAKLCAAANVPCLASLEKKMACGLGACLGCTCHTKIGPVTVCKDGPVFNAQEVFD